MATKARVVRIATRASELARWQADHVASLLGAAHPGLGIEVVPVSTEGDRRTDVPLSSIGGKGVFSKEVQRAVLDGRADLAVHSAKDLPAITPDGLVIAALPERGDPRDALVGADLEGLGEALGGPRAVVVATGSARRRVQLSQLLPGLRFDELRGNMATRLERSVGFDAIVVAAAALGRLGLEDRLSEVLSPTLLVPQVGQGALAVECRSGDQELVELLGSLDHPPTRLTVGVERAFLAELGGDCSLPAGAHCTLVAAGTEATVASTEGTIRVEGILADSVEPGARVARRSLTIDRDTADPRKAGRDLARALRSELEAM